MYVVGGWADEPTIKLFEARSDGLESHADARHIDIYVLEGELRVHGERAGTGAWAQVPPWLPHTREGTARYLVIQTPA